ncbi:MAG: DUF2846 domain-containing protein [Desulfobulbaceae bacterium]|nr:DUF2846 domain-containing protein [Desulfobulbaceae bacterium]
MMANTPYEAIAPNNGDALVYVYRPESVWWRGTPFIVYAGDKKYDPLINNAYYPVHVKPGTVFFRLTTKSTVFGEQRVDAVEMSVESGKVYYLKVKPRPAGAFKFVIMTSDEGSKEVASTKFYYTEK